MKKLILSCRGVQNTHTYISSTCKLHDHHVDDPMVWSIKTQTKQRGRQLKPNLEVYNYKGTQLLLAMHYNPQTL